VRNTEPYLVTVDTRHRATLKGPRPGQRFWVTETNGVIVLDPVRDNDSEQEES
jgi:hypothetical protein